jgi:hypothetical protein
MCKLVYRFYVYSYVSLATHYTLQIIDIINLFTCLAVLTHNFIYGNGDKKSARWNSYDDRRWNPCVSSILLYYYTFVCLAQNSNIMSQSEFDTRNAYVRPTKQLNPTKCVKQQCVHTFAFYILSPRLTCSRQRVWRALTSFLPIIDWLPKYNIREDLAPDAIAGITVGIMHIPQGMAYASLAGLDPVYGLYTSFWPSLFYLFFGTSRHVSLGLSICFNSAKPHS